MIDRETPFGWCCIMQGIAYPCTIVPARYGGCYEGGSWLAFPCNPDRVPDGWDGGDVECAGFFAENRGAPIGRGVSPDAAHDDLVRRLRQYAPTPQEERLPTVDEVRGILKRAAPTPQEERAEGGGEHG